MHAAFRSTLGLSTLLGTLVVAGSLLATPAAAQLSANLAGTPDDGMICRSGYTGAIVDGAFKCSKTTSTLLNLECRSQFPNYVVRAAGSPGTPDGRDLCTRAAISLGSTDAIGGLVAGRDYVKADVSQAMADSATAAVAAAEVTALGLTASDVDAAAQEPTINTNATGSRDKARIGIKLYTFAAPRGASLSARR